MYEVREYHGNDVVVRRRDSVEQAEHLYRRLKQDGVDARVFRATTTQSHKRTVFLPVHL